MSVKIVKIGDRKGTKFETNCSRPSTCLSPKLFTFNLDFTLTRITEKLTIVKITFIRYSPFLPFRVEYADEVDFVLQTTD